MHIQPLYRWIFVALIFFGHCQLTAEDIPWTMLIPAQDSRAADICNFDEADIRNMIDVLNKSNKLNHAHFVFSQTSINGLLDALTPFAVLHFDSVNPMEFTSAEKSILKEWFKRGGFLIACEDTYPYTQEEFRKDRQLPVFNFLIKELPASDPEFTIGKAGPTHPVFTDPFLTKPAPPFAIEIRENPNYKGFTMLFYKGKMAVFFLGRYNYMENGRWVPRARPFENYHGLLVESYLLYLNLYFQALTR